MHPEIVPGICAMICSEREYWHLNDIYGRMGSMFSGKLNYRSGPKHSKFAFLTPTAPSVLLRFWNPFQIFPAPLHLLPDSPFPNSATYNTHRYPYSPVIPIYSCSPPTSSPNHSHRIESQAPHANSPSEKVWNPTFYARNYAYCCKWKWDGALLYFHNCRGNHRDIARKCCAEQYVYVLQYTAWYKANYCCVHAFYSFCSPQLRMSFVPVFSGTCRRRRHIYKSLKTDDRHFIHMRWGRKYQMIYTVLLKSFPLSTKRLYVDICLLTTF